MQPLVSIIIPVYNAEKYLGEAINSVLNQTYKNIDIIIVDDGSTDSSLAVAKTFESDGVRIFSQTNKGASAARNKGLNEAKGAYIQYLDSDDLLSACKIQHQINLLNDKPGYISTGPAVYFIDGQDYLMRNPEDHWIKSGSDNPVGFLIKLYGGDLIGPEYGGMVPLHSWLCPKDVLTKAGGWNEGLSVDDDGEYFCRVILASEGIVHSEDSVSYYRKYLSSKSLSSLRDKEAYQSIIRATDLKFSHLHKAAEDKEIVNKIFARLYNHAAMVTYPKFKDQSEYAYQKAKALWDLPFQYKAGPLSTFLAKILGWRLMRKLNYYRHGI